MRVFHVPTADALQAVLVAVLVAVTAAYAWSTNKIAVSTKQQADASTRAVEEMQRQRYDSLKPILDIKLGYVRNKSNDGYSFPDYFQISVANKGIGPALNVNCESLGFGSRKFKFVGGPLTVLGAGESIGHADRVSIPADWSFSLIEQEVVTTSETVKPFVQADYDDVFGIRWTSKLEIVKDKASNWIGGRLSVEKRQEANDDP